jgi:hypothetical protein
LTKAEENSTRLGLGAIKGELPVRVDGMTNRECPGLGVKGYEV